jgi:hypothetical protein
MMAKHRHAELIAELGGPTAFGRRLLGDEFEPANDAGRVWNWTHRGIPKYMRPAVSKMCLEWSDELFSWSRTLGAGK